MTDKKPRIGISSCLLGQKVRYDGGHKRDYFLTDTLGEFVEWVPVCPELEVGMGVPRESIRLEGSTNSPRLIAERSGRDWTDAMQSYSVKKIEYLKTLNLSGYILKKDSPTCGMERVRVYGKGGSPNKNGVGMFARALTDNWPMLPLEEEGRLNDPKLRENFIERVFTFQRLDVLIENPSRHALVEFHASHKLLLMAHNESIMRGMGRIVADTKSRHIKDIVDDYGVSLMKAMQEPSSVKKHSNVLQHMLGFFSDLLSKDERRELLSVFSDYKRGLIPLIVPLTLIRHYVRKFNISYLIGQIYLEPSHKELMLRNHV